MEQVDAGSVAGVRARAVSLRWSLGSAFVITVVLTAFLLGAVTFFSVRTQLRQNLGQRLMDLAGMAALSLDAERHAGLRDPADMDGEIYKDLRARVRRIQDVNPDIKYVYTFRWISESELMFILDSGATGKDFSPLGEIYKDLTPQLSASFSAPYRTRVDDAFYPDQYGIWLSGYAPLLRADGSLEAVLGVDISAAKVIAYENYYLLLIAAACVAVSLFGAFGGILFSRRISRPLLTIASDMRRIQRFDLGEMEPVSSRISEVIVMDTALKDMKKGLRSFKRYVPGDVVLSLMKLQKEAVLGTSRARLSFFFSDLENFTQVSESLDPRTLSLFLDDYFDAMTRALQENRATVDKFIGDSIMAFWNAPNPVEDHALVACRAALACQEALRGVWERWRGRGVPTMRTRMGIHTGEALVGNIGHRDRLSYTAIGGHGQSRQPPRGAQQGVRNPHPPQRGHEGRAGRRDEPPAHRPRGRQGQERRHSGLRTALRPQSPQGDRRFPGGLGRGNGTLRGPPVGRGIPALRDPPGAEAGRRPEQGLPRALQGFRGQFAGGGLGRRRGDDREIRGNSRNPGQPGYSSTSTAAPVNWLLYRSA